MDEKRIYRLESLIKSSLFKMNHMWEGAVGSDRVWFTGAYEDLTKALELVEKEIDRIEDDA